MTDQPWVSPGSSSGEPPRRDNPPPPPAAPGSVPPVSFPPGSYPPPAGPPPYGAGAPGPPPYARADVRPGIVALRPLTLGDLFGGVFTAIRGNPGATLGLAAVTTFLFLLPTTALGAWLSGQSGLDLFSESAGASDTLPSGFGLGLLGTYLPAVGQTLSAILLAGFLAQVVGQAVLGRKVSMGATWRGTRGRVLPLLGAVGVTILAFSGAVVVCIGIPVGIIAYAEAAGSGNLALEVLSVVLGVLVLVLVLVILSTRWAFATSAIVLERVGVLGGLGRSWRLTGGLFTGTFWRIFGIRLLTGFVVGIASSIVTLPLTFLLLIGAVALMGGDPGGSTLLVLQTVVSGISGLLTGALTTPFSAGIDALLYVDARIRTEGLDVRLIQATQGAAEPPWPALAP